MKKRTYLQKKVTVPRPELGHIFRSRLVAKLISAKGKDEHVLIVAPPGMGKTSLMASWAFSKRNTPCAWLTLDSMDNDLFRFVSYIGYAFLSADEHIKVPDFYEEDSLGFDEAISYLDDLICAIAERKSSLTLMLDNYHVIKEDSLANKVTAYLAQNAPSNLTLCICSRSVPSIGFGRIRQESKLTILDETDLNFTQDETGEYLRNLGLESFEITAESMHSATGGWPAFLSLAVTACDTDKAFDAKSPRYLEAITHYVIEEIVNVYDKKVQEFIATTVQIDPFCASLSHAVMEWSRMEVNRAIRLLEKDRILRPLSAEEELEPWFVYVPQIAQAIKSRFQALSDRPIQEVYRRASEWLAEAGKLNLATRYAKKIRDWSQITNLIEDHWLDLGMDGNDYMLYSWGKMVPKEHLATRPKACSILSFAAALNGDSPFSVFCDSTAHDYFTDPSLPFYAESNVYRLQLCGIQGRYEDAHKALAIALQHSGSLNFYLTHLVSQHQIMLSNEPDWLRFRDLIFDMLPVTAVKSSAGYLGHNYSMLSMCEAFLGNFTKALEYVRLGAQMPTKAQHPARAALMNTYFTHLSVSYFRGDLESAESHLKDFDQIPRGTSLAFFSSLSKVFRAIFEYTRGSLCEASLLLDEASKAAAYGPLVAPIPIEMVKKVEAEGSFDFFGFTDDSCVGHESSFIWHRLRFIKDFLSGERKSLHELEVMTAAIETDRRLWRIQANILLALYYNAEDMVEASSESFRRALALAEPELIVQPFCCDSTYLLPIVSRLPESRQVETFAQRLYGEMSRIVNGESKLRARSDEVTLSAREKEIIYQISSGYKTINIAQRLGISETTVRKHIANIYKKFGVHSRTQLLLRIM